jgi:exopolysaccharide biosynthesis polyprenyl glycosylphosphotransferase
MPPINDQLARPGASGEAVLPGGRMRVDPWATTSAASSASSPVAAGHDAAIPRTFVVLCDVAVMIMAFLVTRPAAPWVQWLLLPGGPLRLTLPAWLALPPGGSPGDFAALPALGWVLAITVPTTALFMELLGGYRQIIQQSRARVAASSVAAPLLALSLVALTLFTLKDFSSSRVFIFTFAGLSVAGLLTYRSTLWLYKTRRLRAGAYARNVLLVGQPSTIDWMVGHFHQNVPPNLFRLAGWLSVGPAVTANREKAHDGPRPPRLGAAEDLGALLVHRPFDEVIAIQSAGDGDWLRQVIEDCDYFRVRLRIVPEALLVGTLHDLRLVFRSEPLRLPEVVLEPPHHESDAVILKRLLDVIVSAVLLLVFSPLFLLIAIAIKLTTPDLPVFYQWRVIGLKGRAFTGYKFTTMVADADEKQADLAARNEMIGPVFKVKDDPRITRLGRFLRKYSLNELPQLWSVLKGDMSLVGPRPAFRHELERYALWHKRKLCVKPGMTCLWQVSGRNRINDFDEWVRLDLEYIDHWSLALDLRILVWTVGTVLRGSGW